MVNTFARDVEKNSYIVEEKIVQPLIMSRNPLIAKRRPLILSENSRLENRAMPVVAAPSAEMVKRLNDIVKKRPFNIFCKYKKYDPL